MAYLQIVGIDRRPDELYDPVSLTRGVEVELEHTTDPDVAKLIAKDHLDEHPRYYEYLDEMERALSGEKRRRHGRNRKAT